MDSNPSRPAVSKAALWTGYVMSTLPVLALLMSGVMKLMKPAPVLQGFAHFGYQECGHTSAFSNSGAPCSILSRKPQFSGLSS